MQPKTQCYELKFIYVLVHCMRPPSLASVTQKAAQKPTCTPRHTNLSLTHPLAPSVVLGLFSVPGY